MKVFATVAASNIIANFGYAWMTGSSGSLAAERIYFQISAIAVYALAVKVLR